MTEPTAYIRLARVPETLSGELREVAEEIGGGLKAVVEALLVPRLTLDAIAAGQRRIIELGGAEDDLGVHLPARIRDELRRLAAAARAPRGDVPTLILAGCAGQVRQEVDAALAAPAAAGGD